MRIPRTTRGGKIKHVVHKEGVFRGLRRLLTNRCIAIALVLIVAGGGLLEYSLHQTDVINSPLIQQIQLNVSPSHNTSFDFAQPAGKKLYLNFTAPESGKIHYVLYKMPSYQVTFYSGNNSFSVYKNYFMDETKQLKIKTEPMSNLTKVGSGTASSGSTIVLNGQPGVLGQEYLLTVTSVSNNTFNAQVSATLNFQLTEHSDWTTGVFGGVLSFAGIFLLAIGISRVHKDTNLR